LAYAPSAASRSIGIESKSNSFVDLADSGQVNLRLAVEVACEVKRPART